MWIKEGIGSSDYVKESKEPPPSGRELYKRQTEQSGTFAGYELMRSDWHPDEIDGDIGIGIKYTQTAGIGETSEGNGGLYFTLTQSEKDNYQRIAEIPKTSLLKQVKIKADMKWTLPKNSRIGFGFSFENGTGNIAYFGDLGIRMGFEKISATQTRFFIEHRARLNRNSAFIINTIHEDRFDASYFQAVLGSIGQKMSVIIEKIANKTYIKIPEFFYIATYYNNGVFSIEKIVNTIEREFTDYSYGDMYVIFGAHNYVFSHPQLGTLQAVENFLNYENYKFVIKDNFNPEFIKRKNEFMAQHTKESLGGVVWQKEML